MAGLFHLDKRAVSAWLGSRPVTAIHFGHLRMWPMDFLDADTALFSLFGLGGDLKRDLFVQVPEAGNLTLTGIDSSINIGSIMHVDAGVIALIGQAIGTYQAARLAAGMAEFTLSGSDADQQLSLMMPASAGMIGLSGGEVNYKSGLQFPVEHALFELTGNKSHFKRRLQAIANAGFYATSFASIPLLRDLRIPAGNSSLTLTGAEVRFPTGLAIFVEPAVFAVGVSDAAMRRTLRFGAMAGTYALAGPVTDVRKDSIQSGDGGIIHLTGNAVQFTAGPKLPAEPAVYMLGGRDANLAAAKTIEVDQTAFVLTTPTVDLSTSYPRRKFAGDQTGRRKLAGDQSGFRRLN